MDSLLRDISFALRSIRNNPGFSIVAALTLALGIGATTAIFSVVDTVLLQPLPYRDPDQLIRIWSSNNEGGVERDLMSSADLVDLEAGSPSVERIIAHFEYDATMKDDEGNAFKVLARGVPPDFFDVLGVSAILGRTFTPDEGNPNETFVAVISNILWRSRFGSDPNIIGTSVTLEGGPLTVIGVAPPGFNFPGSTVAWLAMDPNQEDLQSRAIRIWDVFGRMKPGAGVETARRELQVVADRLEEEYPATNRGFGTAAISLHEATVGDLASTILILFGAAGVLLLIACVNVANLMLARAAARSREIALRAALGAGRWRIVRQLLTESFVLAVAGTVVGLLIAFGLIQGLNAYGPDGLLLFGELGIDSGVLLFALATTLVTSFLFGLAPAVRMGRTDLKEALHDGGRGSTGDASRNRVRTALVVSELALAVMLVIGAGLLVRSYSNLAGTNPGFRSDGVLTFDLALPFTQYAELWDVGSFFDRMLEQLEALPGVEAASATSTLPLGLQLDYQVPIVIEGQPTPEPGQEPKVYSRQVGPGLFRLMGIPLLRGRDFEIRDNREAPGVAIINDAAAKRYFPGEDPIGKTITGIQGDYGPLGRISKERVEIVGIVGDVHYENLVDEPLPSLYFPMGQAPFRRMTMTLSTRGDPASLIADVRSEVASMDGDLALGQTTPLDRIFAFSIAPQRFSMFLLTGFGMVALVLASIGVYGVISYNVAQRMGEMGIRMALGAQPGDVQALVMRHGLMVAMLGVGGGLFAAWAMRRVVASQLHGLNAADPWTFAGAAVLLAATALAATFIPAVRASRVDPMVALRPE